MADGAAVAPPTLWMRGVCAIVFAVLSGLFVFIEWRELPVGALATDFDHIWGAARTLVRGEDPYLQVGPGRPVDWPWQLYYPLPAVLLTVPFSYLPLDLSRATFAGIGAGLLVFALTASGWRWLLVLGSAAFYHSLLRVQWSPYLVAAALLPWLGGLLAVKPTVGAALWIARPTRAALASGIVLGVLSFVVLPGWPAGWLAALATSSHLRAPVTMYGGVVLLIALTRWRRPEARLLAALACVPQTTVLYDTLPLLLVPRTTIELGLLVLCTHAAWYFKNLLGPYGSWSASVTAGGYINLLAIYLPALIMVLRRPNEGTVPSWVVAVGRAIGSRLVWHRRQSH